MFFSNKLGRHFFELMEARDWSALGDVLNFERVLWFLTIVSILLNIAPILLELKGKNN